jgi:uncharacterized RDD family membrane protein YckC
MPMNLPERADAPFEWSTQPPDPLDRPEYYDGLIWRRSLAFLLDACLMLLVMVPLWLLNLFTFFLLTAALVFLWAAPLFVIYYTVTVGGSLGATLGMRCLGLRVRDWTGRKATYLHAFIASALFWFLVPLTGGLILLVGLFSNRRRQVHDMLSGTVVINVKGA